MVELRSGGVGVAPAFGLWAELGLIVVSAVGRV
ncbi:hypothetical protein LINPERPRIM_LOCUS33303, partial [Linum perenne]